MNYIATFFVGVVVGAVALVFVFRVNPRLALKSLGIANKLDVIYDDILRKIKEARREQEHVAKN